MDAFGKTDAWHDIYCLTLGLMTLEKGSFIVMKVMCRLHYKTLQLLDSVTWFRCWKCRVVDRYITFT